MRHLILLLVTISCLSCAETEWPAVPDPIGLGPRLALIDWLRERKVQVPATATDEQLVGLWRKETGIDPERDAALRAAEAEAEQARIERERRAEVDRRRSEAAVAAALESQRDRPSTSSNEGSAQAALPQAVPDPSSITRSSPVPPPIPARPAISPPAAAPTETPTPRADNLRDWAANYGSAPSSTRNNVTVTVYLRRGDAKNFWVLTEMRREAETTRMWIDGEDYGFPHRGLRQVAARKPFGTKPDLTLTAP